MKTFIKVTFVILFGLIQALKPESVVHPLVFTSFSNNLDSILIAIVREFKYPVGIAFRDLSSDEKFLYNEKEIFPTASAIKIEILIHLFKEYERGNINVYENIPVNFRIGGSGILQYFDQSELNLSYYNLAVLMIQQSDNTATNILINKLGMENINNEIVKWGLKNTKLQRVMMDFEARKAGKENISTPEDKLKLLEMIYHQTLLPDSLNNEAIKILSIPKNSPLKNEIKEEFSLASKGGELDDVRCEMGIFYFKHFNYILVVMTKNLPDSNLGDELIRKVSHEVYRYMQRKYGENFK